jgi:NAD(P)-dependent dehydrogenase (short-subunit alcohol dehydrogenase family)
VCRQENYDRKLAYAKSKLANIVFAYELARRFRQTPLVSNAVDPGGVATNLGRNNGLLSWMRHLLYYALKRELLSPRRGAETIVHLATDPSIAGVSGKYFFEKHERESSAISHDRSAADELWSLSSKLTRLKQETLVEHS